VDLFGNRVARVLAPAGAFRISYDNVCRDSGIGEAWGWGSQQDDVNDLPPECLRFLLASRYCEVDRFIEPAWKLFGHTPQGWDRVKAICDFVHHHIQFGYEFASNTKTAWDVYHERRGVCRDFMHLTVALLRAMNIPARYATGYLGDIGVPIAPFPMDFSAWLEVYCGRRWWTLDTRHNEPRIGRVLMARGRDAVDCALTTSFGTAVLKSFKVVTDEVGK
jgi:transglutaminase-like putative cysteine protease